MNRLKDFVFEITGKYLTEYQTEQFEKYYEMLIEKNKVMNLTAITEKDEVILKHFIDSIILSKYYNFEKGICVIDIGTGAGFPGIPLKIVFPHINMTLFDSLNKRVVFLQEIIDALGLDEEQGHCRAIHGRAEEGGRNNKLRESFDLAVSRAVANMSVLSEYALPFVRQNGYFISYKTKDVDEELNKGKSAISLLGGKLERVEKLTLPNSDIGRSFVFIKKIKQTPKAYPRKAGTASKQPL